MDRTTLHKPWLFKIVVMTVVVLGFGSWGLFDALVAYPKRGADSASFLEREYLAAADQADREEPGVMLRTEQAGDTQRGVSLADPAAELKRLAQGDVRKSIDEDAKNPSSRQTLRAQMLLARERWLTALSRIGELRPERTTFEDPRAKLAELTTLWQTRPRPSPLASYDIPSQWIIAGACYVWGAYLLWLFATVASKSYRWDAEEQRLTLPGGASLVPADLAEVDKRKWDKFIVSLMVKPGHERLGGQAVKVDTYRYAKLEDWILEMEAAAFPDTVEPAEGAEMADADAEAPAEASAAAANSAVPNAGASDPA